MLLFKLPSFPLPIDPEFEIKKLNLCRIIIGALALIRLSLAVHSSFYYFSSDTSFLGFPVPSASLFGIFTILITVLFVLGVFTPLTTIGFLLAHKHFDLLFSTYNLGSNTLYLIHFLFIMTNTGTRYSLDGFVMDKYRESLLSKILTRLYSFVGAPNRGQLSFLLLGLFLAYSTIHFRALLFHIRDEYWITGKTTWALVTQAYFCKRYALFRSIEEAWPRLLPWFSVLTGIFQFLWQALMIPMFFTKVFRPFVIYWGWAFILFSWWALNISFLPYYEILLWVILFVRPPLPAPAMKNTAGQGRSFAVSKALVITAIVFSIFQPILIFSLGETRMAVSSSGFIRFAGLQPPNVFNRLDLRTSHQWPVIYRTKGRADLNPVPFNGLAGNRLAYHKNDLLYFSNSLNWRRMMIDGDVIAMNKPGTEGYELLKKVVWYDYRRNKLSEPAAYRIDFYKNSSTDLDIKDLKARYSPILVHSFTMDINPGSP